ncbi:MAG: hypothetical protein LBE95_00570 [Holosporaceae bacterium]|jgi:hypothetical protein|nr:hypothetical protein [Holosporaceae bacterium]
MSKLLRRVSYAILGLCLAMKSDVSGMKLSPDVLVDTSKGEVVAKSGTMKIQATGNVVISIDLGNIGVTGQWVFDFTTKDGKFESPEKTLKKIMPSRTTKVGLKLEGAEVKNGSNVVAYSGLIVGGTEMNENSNETIITFEKDKEVALQWVLYKENKSGDKFAPGDDLPETWAGKLECGMTLSVVAAS